MSRQEINKKFDEIVDFSEIGKFIDTPVKRYSSGMYVRLAFAVGVHLDSEILILDEVLAVGDINFQKKCARKMEDVRKQGRTILFVSHGIGTVQQICSRALMLEEGRMVSCGAVGDITREYLERSAETDENRPGRSGNRTAEFIKWRLLDGTGHESSEILIGDNWKVEFLIKFNSNVSEAQIAVEIRTPLDDAIAHSMNTDDMKHIGGTQGELLLVSVELQRVFITPGSYYVSLYIGSGDIVFDFMPECFRIKVIQAEQLSRGTEYPKHMKVYLPSVWTISKQ